MAVIDGRTPRGFAKENNLPFEGFLEALCRLSLLKALPTDAELAETGCADAGLFMQRLREGTLSDDYLDALRANSETFADELTSFLIGRAVEWGDDSHPQSLARCVDHTIACIIRTVEDNSAGDDNMALTQKETRLWAQACGI